MPSYITLFHTKEKSSQGHRITLEYTCTSQQNIEITIFVCLTSLINKNIFALQIYSECYQYIQFELTTLYNQVPIVFQNKTKDPKSTKKKKRKKKEAPHVPLNNNIGDKKTTFADQGLGFDAQIIRAKQRQRKQKICRITSFVLVVVFIAVGAVAAIYFLVTNENSQETVPTSTPSING